MLSRICLHGVSRSLNHGLAALPLGASQLQILGQAVQASCIRLRGRNSNVLHLFAELAAVAARSDDARIIVSAGRALVTCNPRHPYYDRQLHTSAQLAQGEALLLALKSHDVHSSAPYTALTQLRWCRTPTGCCRFTTGWKHYQ